jgi:hypothetical protein
VQWIKASQRFALFVPFLVFSSLEQAHSLQTKKAPLYRSDALIRVIATGFEPVTVCLEGRCSIQLSYATIFGLQIYGPF